MCEQSLSCVCFFAAPWTVACQAPLSMEFSRQENWRGLPFPTPEHLLDPGIEPLSLCISCIARHCTTWEDNASYIILQILDWARFASSCFFSGQRGTTFTPFEICDALFYYTPLVLCLEYSNLFLIYETFLSSPKQLMARFSDSGSKNRSSDKYKYIHGN